jgi:hypothetical protein
MKIAETVADETEKITHIIHSSPLEIAISHHMGIIADTSR